MKTQSGRKSLSCCSSGQPVLLVNVMLTFLMYCCINTHRGDLVFVTWAYLIIFSHCELWCRVKAGSCHLSTRFITAASSGRNVQVWNPVKQINRQSAQTAIQICFVEEDCWMVGQVGAGRWHTASRLLPENGFANLKRLSEEFLHWLPLLMDSKSLVNVWFLHQAQTRKRRAQRFWLILDYLEIVCLNGGRWIFPNTAAW